MILYRINKALWVFYANAQCKGFVFDRDLFAMQQFKYIAGRMTGSQYQCVGQELVAVGGFYTF
jgi:hypothetical protein